MNTFLNICLIIAAGALLTAGEVIASSLPRPPSPAPLPVATVSCGAYEVTFAGHDPASVSDADEAAMNYWATHACREVVTSHLVGHEHIN